MSVTPEDVVQIAHLARLEIAENELDTVVERFGRILELVDELQAVDVSDTAPMSNPHDDIQRLRPDVVSRGDNREALQSAAPAVEEGYFLVPKVID
ncbi:glutamyl-tRNA(Gln) amidotransferase, C subunit [Luminiphilus syltensis NOR5-1B]|uniref:Aspartyl/glutamyl-tRNA(Asn/Gln) amidotransferase subunit C n=1 Tax=Luminiphilus syltensis NOR5-1B TaxID=565045 RepID=B8KR98_9GAMM|nr:Asp-tRNA(Asn)/Glu-tRNA(Gln) amidotransferase subunit GatC [Luminiphilus syltensis]EED36390.1 glutamyl-tRNA(Gln) amidotransferase, C subunit [Luminiphilus syltensis NOR5-1B]